MALCPPAHCNRFHALAETRGENLPPDRPHSQLTDGSSGTGEQNATEVDATGVGRAVTHMLQPGGLHPVRISSRENAVIEPTIKRLRVITTEILRHGPGGNRWAQFRKVGKQLVSEMMIHLEKEELAIVQRLDSLLDADSDHRLAFSSISRRGCRPRLPSAAAMGTSNRR